MQYEDFQDLINEAIKRSNALLLRKGNEYTMEGDRLGQFTAAAHLQSITPSEALFGMLAKHLTSVADMVKSPTLYGFEKWYEKLDDIRNYTLLLEGVVKDMAMENKDKHLARSGKIDLQKL